MRFRHAIAALFASLVLGQSAFAGCVPLWTIGRTAQWAHGELTSGDFNGDGLTDLATTADHQVLVRPTIATGFGTSSVVFSGDYLPNHLLAVDIQGDGKLDLIAADIANNSLIAIPGNGDGTFGAAVITPVAISPSRIVAGDFTGDGLIDVAFASYSANVLAVWRGNGTGAFTQELARTAIDDLPEYAIAAGDLDGDALADVILTYYQSTRVDIFFSNGNGTFDPPLQLTGGLYGTSIALADLDDDGDQDLATADWTAYTMTVIRNDGSRTFAPSVQYSADYPWSYGDNPDAIVAADVTQDGVLDLIIVAPNSRNIVTYEGNGDATFGPATYAYVGTFPGVYSFLPTTLVAGHFNGDGRIDVVAGEAYGGHIGMYPNNCGDVTASLSSIYPVVSAGDRATFRVNVQTPGGSQATGYGPPSGTVKLFEGETAVGSGTLGAWPVGAAADIEVSGLATGTHQIHAVYQGDDHYDEATSTAVTQKVITTKVTATLTTSVPGPFRYGQSIQLIATTTASDGTQPTGPFYLFTNDQSGNWTAARPATWTLWLHALTTTRYRAHFLGDATFPPDMSDELTVKVEKAAVKFRPAYGAYANNSLSIVGTTKIWFEVDGEFGGNPTGPVSLYKGETLLGTAQRDNWGEVQFTPSLPVGTHTLRLVHGGDNYFSPTTYEFRHDVVPNGFAISATGGSSITVRWIADSNLSIGSFSVKRLANGSWTEVAKPSYWERQYVDPAPQAGVAYVYRVDALRYDNTLLMQSTVAMAMHVQFSNNPVTSGTPIRALHITELVNATNALRTAAGMSPFTLAVAKGTAIRATHFLTLRTAINDARTALGIPPLAYDGSAPAPGERVRTFQIQELRNGFR